MSRVKRLCKIHCQRELWSIRTGFSAIDLLGALGIVALVSSVLVPSIQAARVSARKQQCLKNIQQLGAGLLSYHEQFASFPPAVQWAGPPGEPLGVGQFPVGVVDRIALGVVTAADPDRVHGNWLVRLLPYLDQQRLWGEFDSQSPISSASNQMVRTTSIALLKCPDDAFNGRPYVRDFARPDPSNVYARGNYAMNLGPGKFCFQEIDASCVTGFHVDSPDLLRANMSFWGDGAGGVNRSFGLKDIRGGASHFVVVDEVRAGVQPMDPRGSWALGYIGASLTARHGGLSEREDASGPNNQHRSADDIVGCNDIKDKIGVAELQRLRMPCWSTKRTDEPQVNIQATSRSMHQPGGVHVLAADGSGRFVSDMITANIWFCLHSRESSPEFDTPF